ncbi:MAG: 5'-3' exonuclease [Cellvibrionaceae bacterium]
MTAIEDKAETPICLLDASIYIFRYYFSLPDNWFSEEGYPTAAVHGYSSFLLSFLLQHNPSQMAACFDESLGSCFRNEIYPDYKSSRALPDEALAFQLNACREVTELLGIASFSSEVYEADDLLGTLMAHVKAQTESDPVKPDIAILTRDKDLGQLIVRSQDYLWDYVNPAKQERLGRTEIQQKFGVWPEQLVDYLALVGDAVDDIPGVAGVGAKTAQALLQWGGDIENIFRQMPQITSLPIRGAKGLAQKLVDHTEQIAISRSLAQIITDIELDLASSSLRRSSPDAEACEDFCERMGFGQPIRKKFNQLVESLVL